uniref:Uncharacterized protein n=1 Tax=Leersia perrieri TaxID=77586 RepID=A0A0D9V0T0_9ORYZ
MPSIDLCSALSLLAGCTPAFLTVVALSLAGSAKLFAATVQTVQGRPLNLQWPRRLTQPPSMQRWRPSTPSTLVTPRYWPRLHRHHLAAPPSS